MPMLGSKFLFKNTKKTQFVLKFEKYYKLFSEFYSETLNYWITKQVNKKLNGKVVTVIRKEKNYVRAEEYHQKYFDKR